MKTQATNSSYTAEDKPSVILREKLPSDWAVLRLGDIADIQGGSQPPKSTFTYEPKEGYVRLLQIRDFGARPVPTYVPKNKVTKFCEKDDIFIARYGASLGRIVTGMEGAYNVALAKVILDKNAIFPKYMFYLLQTPVFQTPIHMISRSAQNGFNKGDVFPIQLPIAPYEQQKRIVAEIEKQFSRLDDAVANLKRVKANLKRYKAAVLKAAVEGKLTEEWRKQHPDVEPASKLLERILAERKDRYKAQLKEWKEVVKSWELSGKKNKKPAKPRNPRDLAVFNSDETGGLSGLPSEWAWIKLGNCNVDVFDGPFGSNLKSSDYVVKGIRVIRLENIGELEFVEDKKTYISESKYNGMKKHKVSSGDIIFSSFIAGCTRAVLLPKHIEVAVNKADCFCVRVHGETILNRFVEIFLGTRSTYDQLVNEIHGATRPRINTTQLKNCAIPVCSLAEQNAIILEVDRKISLLKEMENEVDVTLIRADSLRQSILCKAFSGALNIVANCNNNRKGCA